MLNTIISDSKESLQDSLIKNLVNQEYLKRDRWDPWLQALIPPNMPYFDPKDPESLYIWTPTLYREANFVRARYILLVYWEAERDDRGTVRLKKKRGWSAGKNPMKVYNRNRGKWLNPKEVEWFIRVELEPRLKRTIGIKELQGKKASKIRRYRFNHGCYFPKSFMAGLDGHHNNIENAIASKRIPADIKEAIDNEWLKATDDRPYNIVPKSRSEHRKIHFEKGDKEFRDLK